VPVLRAALHQGFLVELTEPAHRAHAGDAVGLADARVAQWQAARAAWPEIAVAAPRFAGELARRIAAHAGGEVGAAARAPLHGGDVHLAVQSRVDMSLDRLLVTGASHQRTPGREHQRAPSVEAHRASAHSTVDESL
jgi:hypothetical protein